MRFLSLLLVVLLYGCAHPVFADGDSDAGRGGDTAVPAAPRVVCDSLLRRSGTLDELAGKVLAALDRSLRHPDRLTTTDLDKLPVGTRLFMDPRVFRSYRPRGLRQVPISSFNVYPVRVTETGVRRVTLHSSEIGEMLFEGEGYRLVAGELYTDANFREHSQFRSGEYVMLTYSSRHDQRGPIFLRDPSSNRMETLPTEKQPLPVRFIRAVNLYEYEVEVPNFEGQGQMRSLVPSGYVTEMPTGTEERLEKALAVYDEVKPNFRMGELVRYRERFAMRYGIIEFITVDGSVQMQGGPLLDGRDVFKVWTPGRPRSIGLNATAYVAGLRAQRVHLKAPRGWLREYLDAAARMTGHPEFRVAKFERKLRMLLAFQDQFLPYHPVGLGIERSGLTDYSEVLCAGAGVCRHNTPLMAAVLEEAGLRPVVQRRMITADEVPWLGETPLGHTWLQVPNPEVNGEEYIVDPSNGVVKIYGKALERAQRNQASPDALWWTSPERLSMDTVELPRPKPEAK